MKSAFNHLNQRFAADDKIDAPRVASFRAFLEEHAQVKLPSGRYGNYTFEGREALLEIVATIDLILGSHTGTPLKDAQLDVCGGAQFGKTVLCLNLGAYVTGCLFRNWGYYLPDDDLVEGIVDTKFRPDVVDQIDWFAAMIQVGKSLNKSGRAVNKKGAFLVTDGKRNAQGMIRGMGKIPTSFSMDVVMEDEKDDIDPKRAKFLKGRMTASDLRCKISIGTQRIHGAGQNKQFEQGSQGVMLVGPEGDSAWSDGSTVQDVPEGWLNPEEAWPHICRVALTGAPRRDDPQLTWDGDFKQAGSLETAAVYDPEAHYYLAHPDTGAPLNRNRILWHHRRPDRIKLRKWSFRVSQMGIPAIDLSQMVSAWQDAVKDSADMIVFCCDRLALPKSTSQALTPEVIDRSRKLDPFDMGLELREGCTAFGGLDTGDRCWFFAREVESAAVKRCRRVDMISLGNVVTRTVELFEALKLSALFIDARPAVNEARTLCWTLNNLLGIQWPVLDKPEDAYIAFPGGLIWDGPKKTWRNLRCAVVEFTKRAEGMGITHKLGQVDDETGVKKFYPIIQANRYETIERAINEFLTPAENVIQVINGKVRQEPVMRLPQRLPGSPAILETLEGHLLVGSQREKDKDGVLGDFVDGVENHLTLADGYSALAELVCAGGSIFGGAISSVQGIRLGQGKFTPRKLERRAL